MANTYNFENEAQEYAAQYCSEHGGNFNPDDIANHFISGTQNKPAPTNYHYWKAWNQGMRFGGHIF